MKNKIGYFLKRNDVCKIKIKDLMQELYTHLFEANIIYESIQHFQSKKLYAFDSLVGDCKCQVRTSMIIDLTQNIHFAEYEMNACLQSISRVIIKLEALIKKINNYNHSECQLLTRTLETISLYNYLEECELNLNLSEDIILISLCFFTTPTNSLLSFINNSFISTNKMKNLLIKAKVTLCELSITYEQNLAKKYGSLEEQRVLTQIEGKGFCSMTSFLPGFKHILQKMKDLQQPIIKKTKAFCACGGMQSIDIKLFTPVDEKFIHNKQAIADNTAAMIIEGYQFPGSFNQLKQILNISTEATIIPREFYKKCACSNPSALIEINTIENTILTTLAQHPQFTNDMTINFEKLDLLGSGFQQEYEHLTSKPGFSREDMSKFFVYHIYPLRIKDALDDDSSAIVEKIAEPRNDFVTHQYGHCPC